MWNFKGTLWNSTQNILPIHWKIWLLYNIEILRALRFKSSYAFLKRPLGLPWERMSTTWKVSMSQHDRKCKYIFIIPQQSWTHIGLITQWELPAHGDIFSQKKFSIVTYCRLALEKYQLTQWGQEKNDHQFCRWHFKINSLVWKLPFWSKFYWYVFPRMQLTTTKHWLR